jgi:hypothetical protein
MDNIYMTKGVGLAVVDIKESVDICSIDSVIRC